MTALLFYLFAGVLGSCLGSKSAILSMEKTGGRMVQQMHPRGEKEQIQDERQT
jgi:hypothetical protein